MRIKNQLHCYLSKIKLEIALLFIAGAVSFLSGFLIFSAKNQFIQAPQLPVLHEELQRFADQNKPIDKIQILKFRDFLDPQKTIPQYQNYLWRNIHRLNIADKSCLFKGDPPSLEILKKAWRFRKLVCEKKDIPESYINTTPYFNPNGETYASLVYKYKFQNQVNINDSAKWIKEHASYFHILELKELNKVIDLQLNASPLNELLKLTWEELYQLVQNQEVVISKFFIFLRINEGMFLYQIYAKERWDVFWQKSLFYPKVQEVSAKSSECFIASGQVCWLYDYNKSLLTHWNPFTVFLVISLLTSLFLFIQLGRLILRRKKEQEKLKFSLEMLTHELRTPLANLGLYAEELRSLYEDLPIKAQMTSIRLLDQLAKLLRITEASQKYLAKDSKFELIYPKMILISSLADFIKYCIEPYDSRIELIWLASENSVRLDPYWTHICISNLIQNAIDHGVAPIKVRIELTNSYWSIEVEDQGIKTFDSNKKSVTSNGMGLGLQLIQKILPFIGGTLTIKFKPTRFKLVFLLDLPISLGGELERRPGSESITFS
jgi:signal transduction histidine kinase